jgi:hypothetical protein
MLLYALMGLLLGTLPISIGLRGLSTDVAHSIAETQEAKVMFDMEASLENYLHAKLEVMKTFPLNERLFEDHTACLARGINHADYFLTKSPGYDQHFHGSDGWLEYGKIVNETLLWVKENCDRIHFAPQDVKPKYYFSPVIRPLGFISRRVQGILTSIKSWAWSTIRPSKTGPRKAGQGIKDSSQKPPLKGLHDNRKLPEVPPNIEFDCSGLLCKLAYNPPTTQQSLQFNSTLAESSIRDLGTFLGIMQTSLSVTDFACHVLLLLQAVFLLLLAWYHSTCLTTATRGLQLYDFRAWLLRIRQLSFAHKRGTCGLILQLGCLIPWYLRLSYGPTISIVVLHAGVFGLVHFCAEGPDNPNIDHLIQSICQMAKLLQSHYVLPRSAVPSGDQAVELPPTSIATVASEAGPMPPYKMVLRYREEDAEKYRLKLFKDCTPECGSKCTEDASARVESAPSFLSNDPMPGHPPASSEDDSWVDVDDDLED